MQKYQPSQIESKWQKKWSEQKLYESDLEKSRKYYVLAEFPYPSGDLHMGHWFTWGGADIFARFKRMEGYSVFFPCGFDAFGLPAENAAIKRNIHPQDWTFENITRMKVQFATMGSSFTFDHEVITCQPKYYHWNQWIFLKMLEKGIVYQDKYLSNWCPSCQTVLANEGVENGKCWRCGSGVVQKAVDQWFFKITSYADRLLWPKPDQKGLSNGVDWPKSVREGQNAWIGKKEGINITYQIQGSDKTITVFTTTPVNFGATFIVIAPEHPLAGDILEKRIETSGEFLEGVKSYILEAKKRKEIERMDDNREKTGANTGLFAINHLTGEEIPIWVADFVLSTIGTGAVQGCPGHDLRDFEFAKKFKLPIKRVVVGGDGDTGEITSPKQIVSSGTKGKMINSDFLNGVDFKEAMQLTMDHFEQKGWGKRVVTYHLHDWSISRQRYWGTPIPVIHCASCGVVPVPDDQLPVELPYDVDYTPKGKSPLASNETWLKVKCPKCAGEASRDADTMDTFVDSSWYFFRYLSPDYKNGSFDQQIARKQMPVDIYFGGAEHTLGHTLYSRFFTKFLKDIGQTDLDEYAQKRVNHGIVLGPDGNKMSKSKGNVVNPDEEVKKFGADAVRVYLAFFMPYEGTGPWISERIWGPYRFLERVWNLFDKIKSDIEVDSKHLFEMHRTIKKVTQEVTGVRFNTAVAALMEWLNFLSKADSISREEYETLIKLLAPFAPHLSEELWSLMGGKSSIHISSWPKFNEKFLIADKQKLAIQINGKIRDVVEMETDLLADESLVLDQALQSPKIQKFLSGKSIKKTILVPGKIFNIVV